MRPTILAIVFVLALSGAACSHEPSDFAGTPAVPPPPLDATPAADATPASPPTTPLPVDPPMRHGPIILAVGQSAQIGPGASLHFEALANDSRCPAKVQCIWAGEVTLSFMLEDSSGAAGFELSSTTKPKAVAGGREFQLMAFSACPTGTAGECATIEIAPAP